MHWLIFYHQFTFIQYDSIIQLTTYICYWPDLQKLKLMICIINLLISSLADNNRAPRAYIREAHRDRNVNGDYPANVDRYRTTNDPLFHSFLGVDLDVFDELLALAGPRIAKLPNHELPIPPAMRLSMCLRFVLFLSICAVMNCIIYLSTSWCYFLFIFQSCCCRASAHYS